MNREELEQKVRNQANHIKIMEELIQRQKREITIMRESLESKNKDLDAFHYVWCDGGCGGGVHRYDAMANTELTEEIVKRAEYNTYRLRIWFINYKFHKKSYKDKIKYFKTLRYRIRNLIGKIYFAL